MRDGHHRSGVLLQVLFEPLDALGIEVVRGLVQQQQVRLLQQQPAQGDPAPLATGQHSDVRIGSRAAQGIHGLLELGIEVPGVLVVDLLLQRPHLGHQCVEVRIGIGHERGDLVVPVDESLRGGDAFFDVLEDGLVGVEFRLLLQDAHGGSRSQAGLAVGRLVLAGHELQQA